MRSALHSTFWLIVAALGTWAAAAYVTTPTFVASGTVVAKREAIEMPLDDTWRHVFEIAYEYQPVGSSSPLRASHPVGEQLFDALSVGSAVKVQYGRPPIVGSLFGPQSSLAASSWWSRRTIESEGTREWLELGAVAAAALLGFIAYRAKHRGLRLAAAAVGVALAVPLLSIGFVAFPLLLWAWYRHRGQGYGWVLLSTAAVSAVALYYRIPWPAPIPSGPQLHATAIVRQVRMVRKIWAGQASSGETIGGQTIRYPFEMIDLEFTPAGAAGPVHALDRIDAGSVAGLQPGARVHVTCSRSDPRAARIVGGTREYARRALTYVLATTYGPAAAIALVLLPATAWVGRRRGQSRADPE